MTHRRALPKEPLKRAVLDVCVFYAGPAQRLNRRATFRCPHCKKNKLEAHPDREIAGCWNANCPVPRTTDAIGLVAFFEGLDEAHDFPRVVERGHEILGPLASEPPSNDGRPIAAKAPPDPDLLDAVYRDLLRLLPATTRDLRRFWRRRGVLPPTVGRARAGSASRPGVLAALPRLEQRFGRAALLSVPGFFEDARGRLSFTLTGDYALLPHHTPTGRVTTLMGRSTTRRQETRTARYVSLRDSGSHLYLFPGHDPDDLVAFTEGPMGAIVAAQETGLAVGAVNGIRSYRSPGGGPLPELAGADLEGRTVPYVPDADDPPNKDVLEEAPKAARALTEPFGGRPALAELPRGSDLDEWLLSLPEGRARRRAALLSLLAAARPLREAPPPV
jgi:hypothetical protein